MRRSAVIETSTLRIFFPGITSDARPETIGSPTVRATNVGPYKAMGLHYLVRKTLFWVVKVHLREFIQVNNFDAASDFPFYSLVIKCMY